MNHLHRAVPAFGPANHPGFSNRSTNERKSMNSNQFRRIDKHRKLPGYTDHRFCVKIDRTMNDVQIETGYCRHRRSTLRCCHDSCYLRCCGCCSCSSMSYCTGRCRNYCRDSCCWNRGNCFRFLDYHCHDSNRNVHHAFWSKQKKRKNIFHFFFVVIESSEKPAILAFSIGADCAHTSKNLRRNSFYSQRIGWKMYKSVELASVNTYSLMVKSKSSNFINFSSKFISTSMDKIWCFSQRHTWDWTEKKTFRTEAF